MKKSFITCIPDLSVSHIHSLYLGYSIKLRKTRNSFDNEILSSVNWGLLYLPTIKTFSMGESSKFPKPWTFEIQVLKLVVCQRIINNIKLNGQMPIDRLKINQRSYYGLNSALWGCLSVESQPQIPEFRNNRENFHPCISSAEIYELENKYDLE